jgi:hypothetical protein
MTRGAAAPREMRELLGLACDLAREAGAVHARGIESALRLEAKSSPTDLVSQVDHEAERLIVKRLGERRPGDGILAGRLAGESSTACAGSSTLDDATNYVRLPGSPSRSASRSKAAAAHRRRLRSSADISTRPSRLGGAATAGRSGHASGPTCRRPWSPPASPTTPRSASCRGWPPRGSSDACATCAAGVRPHSTSVTSPPGASTHTGSSTFAVGLCDRQRHRARPAPK